MKHAGKLFTALVILILIMSMLGCKPAQQLAQSDTTTKIEIKKELKDTTIYLTDSAGLCALLYCDSIGQARIRQIEQFYAGQWVKPKVIIKDNYLTVDCKIDSAAVTIRWTETHTDSSQSIKEVIIEKVNYVTGFQWFQIWLCRILLMIGILVAAFFSIKNQWYTMLINLGISLVNKLKKKK